MNEQTAITRAQNLAKRNGREYYVVCEDGEFDTCDEDTLETYYQGANPLWFIDLEGQAERVI